METSGNVRFCDWLDITLILEGNFHSFGKYPPKPIVLHDAVSESPRVLDGVKTPVVQDAHPRKKAEV